MLFMFINSLLQKLLQKWLSDINYFLSVVIKLAYYMKRSSLIHYLESNIITFYSSYMTPAMYMYVSSTKIETSV